MAWSTYQLFSWISKLSTVSFKESHPVNPPKPSKGNHGVSWHVFFRIEPEMAFANLEDDMDCAEAYIRPAAYPKKATATWWWLVK